MSVIAKLQHNHGERGASGAHIYLGAVYEGSDELQALSENAIFGSASPSGSISLHGDVPMEKFGERDDEFYVHFDEAVVQRPGTFLHFVLHKTYESQFNPNLPNNSISFRFAVTGDGIYGDFNISVMNPAAIKQLSARDSWHGSVRLANDPQSPRVVELLQQMLDAQTKHYKEEGRSEAQIELWTRKLSRKLARAKGQEPL